MVGVFNVFHDGSIISARTRGRNLVLEIDILYLAARVKPGFSKFILHLDNVSRCSLSTWESDSNRSSREITDHEAIFAGDLQILSATCKKHELQVCLEQSSTSLSYCGGGLNLQIERVRIYDEAGTEWTFSELVDLANLYWNDWEKTAPKNVS